MLRIYQTSDAAALAHVFSDAVRGLASPDYSSRQIAVWSSFSQDIEGFHQQLELGVTIVAEDSDDLPHPIAFGQLYPGDRIAYLYTASACARRGLASQIYCELERHAIAADVITIRTEASLIALPFSPKWGSQSSRRKSSSVRACSLRDF